MKGVIRFSINNKFAVWLLTILVLIAGLMAGTSMKQETIPNIEIPILTVTTVYPGAAPQEVLDDITAPIEQRVRNLSGVDLVQSSSNENYSLIVMNYDYDADLDQAKSELQEAIADIDLPDSAMSTEISKINLNAFPVISFSVTGEGMTLEQITGLVETELQPELAGIEGVGEVSITGQQMKELQLTFHPEQLAQYGLSEETVRGIIQGSALNVPLGLFEMGQAEKTIVVDGAVTTLEDLQNLAIPLIPTAAGGAGQAQPQEQPQEQPQAQPQGAAGQGQAFAGLPTVALSEVADVELVTLSDSISRTNGKESIGISITKAGDANTVAVVNEAKSILEKFEEAHPGFESLTMFDQGEPIEESVHTMLSKAVFGGLFAIIVILLFLRNIRTTLISVVSIPLSLVIAILILKQMDISLNIMTLGAMTVAIGRVVDDSIVVIENTYRRMGLSDEKLSGKELIIDATKEMFVPILASTLVTIAVFLPLGTVSGPIGELFMPFALTMVFSLLASLLVAITVVPAMAHFMFRNGLKGKKQDHESVGKLGNGYRKVLNWCLNHKFVTSAVSVVLLVASLLLTSVVGVSFLPAEEQKYVAVTYTPGPGMLMEDVAANAMEAEQLILQRENVTDLQYSVGGVNPLTAVPSKDGLFYVIYDEDTPKFDEEKEALLAELQAIDPNGTWAQMDITGGGLGGSTFSLYVYGDSQEDIAAAVTQIQQLIEQDPNFKDAENSLSETYEQYTLVADQQKLSSLGLTAGQIAMNLSPARERPVLTTVSVDGTEYEVYVQTEGETYGSIEDIENKTIQSPLGFPVRLGDVVTVEEGTTPNTIARQDGKLYASVSATITSKDVGKASSDMLKKIDELDLQNVTTDTGGVTEQINETFTQLGLAMAAAVGIVYFLLVVTFGGASTPFAILFSLPFTVIGGLVALFLAGETISASVMMGMLMLIGIVVTNAIVLIDRVLHKEAEGLSVREALLEAAGTRLRPILMTALATIGALLPLVLGFEESSGSLISKGLGVTVIGGLVSSTALTLVIVPIVYELLSKFRRKKPGVEAAS